MSSEPCTRRQEFSRLQRTLYTKNNSLVFFTTWTYQAHCTVVGRHFNF